MLRAMKHMAMLVFLFTSVGFLGAHCGCNHDNSVWDDLRAGNRKYVKSPKYAKQRKPFVNSQSPNAIVLSCADSRVTPEFIFSADIGELFVVRSAGQVTDDVVVDSIEFAVRTFDPSVLLIMGHTDCGAVRGALERLRMNGGVIDKQIGHLLAVLIPIEKAIVASGMDIYAPDALEQATRVNVEYIANQLINQSKPIADAVASGKVILVGALYKLGSGEVCEYFQL